MTKKILTIVFSVLVIGVFAFLLTWGIINWSKVKEGMAGNGLYTQTDVQNAYEDGYNTALSDKEEYDDLINEYRDTITTLTDNISQLNSEKSSLTRSNNALELQIVNLTQLKESLELQVETLTANKEMNEATIAELNSQIIGLNTEIATLTLQLQNHNSVVNALNKTISDLQSSINYYEQYIASLETGETVVATFEFDGKVYSIQVVNKGSIVTVNNPSSSEYVIFNGWTVNGQPVNLAQYTVNSNTKFVADITYKYLVKFTVDGSEHTRQTVQKDSYATLPTAPTKTDYIFVGWTLDGVNVVNIDTYAITEHTTFIAKFEKQSFVVQFTVDGSIHNSQTIEKGGYAELPAEPQKEDYQFVGWSLNGNQTVDVERYAITERTSFIAVFKTLGRVIDMDFDTLGNGSIQSIKIEIGTVRVGQTVTFSITLMDLGTVYDDYYPLEITRVVLRDEYGEEIQDLSEIYGKDGKMTTVGEKYYFSFTVPDDYDGEYLSLMIYLMRL